MTDKDILRDAKIEAILREFTREPIDHEREMARKIWDAASEADPWHDAILTECMRIEGAYQKDDPVKTVASLIDWHVKNASEGGAVPDGYALVPLRLNVEMNRVMEQEGWQWEDLLAAAGAITEQQYADVSTEGGGEPVAWVHQLVAEGDQLIREVIDRYPDHPFGEPGENFSAEYERPSQPLYAAPPSAPAAEPILSLTGAQLAEALEFVAPDRDESQMESIAYIQYGDGHSGKGHYCWLDDCPEDGAILLDGSTAVPAAESAEPVGLECERCGEGPEAHTAGHPCSNQSFRVPTAATADAQGDERAAVYIQDDEQPEYLDGIECQYSVRQKTGTGRFDYKIIAWVFEKQDAELIRAALSRQPSAAAKCPWSDVHPDCAVAKPPAPASAGDVELPPLKSMAAGCFDNSESVVSKEDCKAFARAAVLADRQKRAQDGAITVPADALDFTPDAQHSIADMANIGKSLMNRIASECPDYAWNDSPCEIVSDLINERDEARAALARQEGGGDAERFEWIASHFVVAHDNWIDGVLTIELSGKTAQDRSQKLRSAIDAARAQRAAQGANDGN